VLNFALPVTLTWQLDFAYDEMRRKKAAVMKRQMKKRILLERNSLFRSLRG